MVRIDLVDEHFGELLKSLKLSENWRGVIRHDMVAQTLAAGVMPETVERGKEHLELKKSRTIKLYDLENKIIAAIKPRPAFLVFADAERDHGV